MGMPRKVDRLVQAVQHDTREFLTDFLTHAQKVIETVRKADDMKVASTDCW